MKTTNYFRFVCSILLMLGLWTNNAFAQAGGYSFSTSATGSLALDKNGNTIDMTTGAASIVAAGTDDSPTSGVLSIGFTFPFCGNNYTQYSVSSNGLVGLGATAVTTSYQVTLATTTTPIISGLAGDMRTFNATLSKVVGTAPNRCLVILLSESGYYAESPLTNDYTYQVRLYESGHIEFVYGSMIVGATAYSGGYQVGFSINGSVANAFQSVTTSTNTNSSSVFTTNFYTALTAVANLNSSSDGSRRVYLFNPPPPCVTPAASPTGLSFTPISVSQINGSFSAASPAADAYLVVRYFTGGTEVAPVNGVNYATGNGLGLGTVVQSSSATAFSATGLIAGSSYDFYIYSLNNLCTGGPFYQPVGRLSGTASTLPATAYTATAQGGLWSNAQTWAGGIVPATGNDVIIPAGSVVTVDLAVTMHNLDISGLLQWNGTANAMTLQGNLTVNNGGVFLPYTTAAGGATGITVNIFGNFINNGYANCALGTGTLTLIQFNGIGSTLGGTGTFQAGSDGRGIIRQLFFASLGSSTINTTQDLTTYNLVHSAGSLNTNGKLKLDNTAQLYGMPLNTQVASVAVTVMGNYSVPPVVFGVAVTQYANALSATLNTRYVSGTHVYLCTVAGTFNATAPTWTTTTPDATSGPTLLYIGETGTLGNPYQITLTTLGTQYFFNGSLYTCTTAGTPTDAGAASLGTTPGVLYTSGTAVFRYAGTPAVVSVNYNGAATLNVRSLNMVSGGTGYSSSTAPTLVFSVGPGGTVTTVASATPVILYSVFGFGNSQIQRSGVATISGGLIINSDQGASASGNIQSSSGVGNISTLSGGVNYTVAPQIAFAGPLALNLITNPGSGYTAAPIITVSGGTIVNGVTPYSSANFTITVNQGTIESVYLTSTSAIYSVPPTLTMSAPGGAGTTATLEFPAGCWPAATANIGTNGQILSFTMTNNGFGYTNAPLVAFGTTSGTPQGGTFTTAATAPTARVALYNVILNFFAPALSAVPAPDDAMIPSNRKINNLALNGNGNGLNLSGNLTIFANPSFFTPLILAASLSTPGNILNLNGNNLLFTYNSYAGTFSTFNSAGANVYIKNGSMTLTGRGGAGTFNYPFAGTTTSGAFTWFVGSTPTANTTGCNATKYTVTELGAPSNLTVGNGSAIGNRGYRAQLNSGALSGTNPTVTMHFNSLDGLATTQDLLFIGDAPALSGAWTVRSTAFGVSGALPATGSKVTATVAPGPITINADNYYAWVTALPCAGPPDVAVVTGPATACDAASITLTAAGVSTNLGITRQWQSAPSCGGSWTNILGANGSTFNTTQTATTSYRMLVTCTFTGQSTPSNCLTVTGASGVNTPVLNSVTANPAAVCFNGSTTLTANTAPVVGAYSVVSIAYAPVSPSGSPTPGPSGDDVIGALIPIGFSFPFYGTVYSNLVIGTNGFISFDAAPGSGCCSGQLIPSTIAPNNLIAACWTDLNTAYGGNIDYFNLTSPNRFVVRYNGVGHHVGTVQVTSEIILYEDGTIEIHNTDINAQGTMTQGIEGPGGTSATPVAGRNALSWAASNDAFRFSPPVGSFTYTWSVASGPGLLSSTSTNPTTATNITANTAFNVTVANGACSASGSVTTTTGLPLSATVTSTPPPAIGYTVAAIPYAPVSPPGGTNPGPAGDDIVSGLIPIGFTFPFYGISYTNLVISTNGFISFDAAPGSGCCTGQLLPSTTTPNNVIALDWEDLNTSVFGNIDYFNLTGPNRFVVRWNNVSVYTSGGGTGAVTGQIIIYEDGTIEVHNGSVTTVYTGQTQGIENAAGTLATVVPGRNSVIGWSATNDAYRFSIPPVTPCPGANWTLAAVATGGGAPYTYAWSGGPISGATNTATVVGTPNADISPTTVYSVVITDNCGATVTQTVSATVQDVHIAVTPTAATVCDYPGNTNLTASGNVTSFNWSPASDLNTTTGTSVIANPPYGSKTYTVSGSLLGCTVSKTSTLTINHSPVVTAAANPPAVCSGGTSQLSGTEIGASSATNLVYSQAFVGGVIASAQATAWCAYRAQLLGSYNYTSLTISGTMLPGGITITDGPTIAAIANALRTGSVYSTTIGGNVWGVGTACGASICGPTPVELYEGPAGTIACSCTALNSIRPEIGTTVNWGGLNGATCPPPSQTMTVTFTVGTNVPPTASTWSWTPATFLDDITLQNPTASNVTATTVYNVAATSAVGCTGPSAPVTLTIPSGNPVLSVGNHQPSPNCPGNAVTLTADYSNAAFPTFLWSTGATTASITVSPTADATYTVTITDFCQGLTASSSATVTVATIGTTSVVPTLNCGPVANVVASLNAFSGGTILWQFQTPFGVGPWTTIPGATTSTIALTANIAAGSGLVTFGLRNEIDGCPNLNSTAILYTQDDPSAPTNVTGGTRCSNGPCIPFAAAVPSGQNVEWYSAATGGTLLGTGTPFCYSPAVTGAIYAADRNPVTGCLGTIRTAANFVVNPAPTVTVSSNSPVCTPSAINFDATAGGVNAAQNGTLTTPALAGNGFAGNVFDITAGPSAVTIQGFQMGITAGTLAKVFYKPGGYGCLTSLSDNTGWIFVGEAAIVPAGAQPALTNIPVAVNVTIPAGQTYGWVVVCNGSNYYTNGTAVCTAYASDANISLNQGLGGSLSDYTNNVFAFLNSPRNFNGSVSYTVGVAGGAAFSWTGPSGFVSASEDPIISPSTLAKEGVYTVTVTNTATGCNSSATTSVIVNQAPALVSLQSATLNGGVATAFPSPPTFLDIPVFTQTLTCDKVVNYNVAITGKPDPAEAVGGITHTMTGATVVPSTGGTGSGTNFTRLIPTGRTTVTVNATNVCGSQSKTFRVTVTDNVVPVITPIQVAATNTNGGECASLVQVTQPSLGNGLFDNCPNSSIVFVSRSDGRSQLEPYYAGTTTVTWQATDASANVSTATQDVVVNNFKPVITSFTTSSNVIFVGQKAKFTAQFTDEDGGGTHTVKFYRDKNDASPASIKVLAPLCTQSCLGTRNYTVSSDSILYSTSEVAEPKVEVLDGCNLAADQNPGVSTYMYLAIAVAGTQFTTEGGHFTMPAGGFPSAYEGMDISMGNVVKKATNGNSYKGQLEMNVHIPNLPDWRVHTDNGSNQDITWDYLTIGGCSLATFKGAVNLNGQSGYKVLVQQSDKDRNPATSNFIRVKVTTNSGTVVFDTQPGLTEALTGGNGGAAAIITALSGGAVKVQPASGCVSRIEDVLTDGSIQNIPNPFTSQTEIRFNVPEDGKYTLTVYNYLGQQVATLFNAEAVTGSTYSVIFDGSNFDAGIYTYTLRSANVNETRRMNLVK